jgi:phosphoglycolate phosphatase-like HAD superfamily hydrolase
MAKDSVFSSLGNDTILWMVGDKWSDVLAGVRAGFSTVLVGEYPYVQKGTTPVPDGLPAPNYVVADAAEAVRTIRSVSGLGR